ncbi:unnamed protein product [Pleuronectes platessa]|uniref:Uncharacterized protein n=1 Tax=Pleuronectes platessa TaxID=8262 RepID=A0A9N7V137_PLEPL|nr:unnamed protein product [Pleuronectes platessa]
MTLPAFAGCSSSHLNNAEDLLYTRLCREPPAECVKGILRKEELHDASKRVRKASTSGDKGSCSGHVDEQNRLQQETSSATASQLHRQLAKPGQEAGTAAAAGQVARQPERELATAPAVTDTRSKTRNREEEENPDMVVMWGVLDT